MTPLLPFLVLAQAGSVLMDCIAPLGEISCTCSKNTVSCVGLQTENVDLIPIIVNVSSVHFIPSDNLENIIINVENLLLSSNSTFEVLRFKNLSLSSGLETLHENLFVGVNESLVWLDLRNNSFESIPSEALHILRLLEHLDMSLNLISSLSKDNFDGLKNLKSLDLRYNNIENVDGEAFFLLENLQFLRLDFNEIQKLGITVFDNLQKLEVLSMSSNLFTAFEPETFTEMSSLQKLAIDHNNFSFLENVNFTSNNLIELSAVNCSFQGSVKRNDLYNLLNLEVLDLSSNYLNLFEESALSALKHLKVLNVSHNNIRELKDDAFAQLISLEELDLKNNGLFVIRTQAFYNLTKLVTLNLSNNKLGAFLCEYTADLLALREIDLQKNKLKIVRAGTFIYSHHLKNIKMEGNILDCTCLTSEFAEYLINSTNLDKMDISSITCSSPTNLIGKPIIDIDYESMKCPISRICNSLVLSAMDDKYDDLLMTTTEVSSVDSSTRIATETIVYAMTVATTTNGVFSTNVSMLPTDTTISEKDIATHNTDTSMPPTLTAVSEKDNATHNTDSSMPPTLITVSEVGYTVHTSNTSMPPTLTTVSEKDNATHNTDTFMPPTVSEVGYTAHTTDTSMPPTLMTVSDVGYTAHTTDTSMPPTLTTVSEVGYTANTTDTTMPPTFTTVSEVGYTVHTTSIPLALTTISEDAFISNVTYGSSEIFTEPSTPGKLPGEMEILVKNHSYVDGVICMEWIMNGAMPSERLQCILLYTYRNPSVPSEHESRQKTQFTCPTLSNEIKQECLKIFKADVLYEFCMQIFKHASRELLVYSCVTHNENITTVPSIFTPDFTNITTSIAVNNSAISTSVSLNLTTSTLPNNNTIFPTIEAISKTNSTFDKSAAVVVETTSEVTKLVFKPFNFTYVNLSFVNETSLQVVWKVNRKEPSFACRLTVRLFHENVTHADVPFRCSDNSHVVTGLNESVDYDMCLTALHITYGSIPICFPVFNPSREYGASTSSEASFLSLPMIVLICLLITIILIAILLTTRAILRIPGGADRYNVSEEEKRVQKRENRGLSNRHSVRYSYTANETDDIL